MMSKKEDMNSKKAKDNDTDEAAIEVLPEGVIARVNLRKPLTDQEGDVHTVLEIREPSGADFVKHGHVYYFDPGGTSMKKDVDALFNYLESCTGIHGALLKTAHPIDLMRATMEIDNFLAQG